MRKRIPLLILLVLVCSSLYAAKDNSQSFISLRSDDPVYPVDSMIGKVCSWNSDESHVILNRALSREFSVSWLDDFVREDSRRVFSLLFSEKLLTLLPLDGFVFSEGLVNSDGSVSVSVRTEDGLVLTFILLDNAIIFASV